MKLSFPFVPQIVPAIKSYTKETFLQDLKAGFIVGIVALPLAIAFGIGSGVSPTVGILSAAVTGFLASLFSGSKFQITGPTGALIIVVSTVIQQFGPTGLIVATLLAGLMLIGLGFLRMGSIIKFMPYPIVVGFTSGIAMGIFTSQIKDFFGLTLVNFDGSPISMPSNIIGKWIIYVQNFDTINLYTTLFAIGTVILIALWHNYLKRIPAYLAAIVITTILGVIINAIVPGDAVIETLGHRFDLHAATLTPKYPELNLETIQILLPEAFTIAMLGAIVTLLCSVVADGATGDRHDSNMELIAQGVANIGSAIFGGIPATGAVARTLTGINNGGRTPMVGVIQAVLLLLFLALLSPLIKMIPVATLAAILVYVSYNMSGWRTIKMMLNDPKSDIIVLFTTFILTIVFNLTIAIEFGMLLAVILFLRRVSETTKVSLFTNQVSGAEYVEGATDLEQLKVPKGVEVYEIEGPFFFGVANKFEEIMKQMGDKPKARIIRMRKVPFIDSTGIHNLETLIKTSQKEGIAVILSGVSTEVNTTLINAGFDKLIGNDYICENITLAISKANDFVK